MSFIYKQMLNNITTDIDALKLEDINIGIGGVALGEGITNLTSALGDEVARALGIEGELRSDLGFELFRAKTKEAELQAEINIINPLIGINNVFSMIKTDQDIPSANVFNLYTSFNTTIK